MSRPNILYVVHRLPYPPDKGDRIRSFNVLKFLSKRAAVHLACLADEEVSAEAIAALGALCERVAVVRLPPRLRWLAAGEAFLKGRSLSEGAFGSAQLRRILRQWAGTTRFQAVVGSSSSVAPYLQLAELEGVGAVMDLMDVDSQKWFDYAAASRGPRSWLYQSEGRRVRRLEQDIAGSADAITLVSDAEVKLFRRFCATGTARAIPNGVDLDYFSPVTMATERSCVFVGALDYRPNVDAASWFCRRIWPALYDQAPAGKMYVVGRRPVRAVRQLARIAGVEVVGSVADVRPYLARSAVVVAPLHIARGIQNKVLEAMAMGKPVVVSPPALAGINAHPGIHLLQASTEQEWIATIGNLFDDAALRQKLGQAGREFVESYHRWEGCLEPFEAVLGLPAGMAIKGTGTGSNVMSAMTRY
jgi:sugar transferase (PEP-CTERM/EpsH1 system associated)